MRQGLIALSFSVAIDAAFLDAFCYIRLQEQDWLNVVQWLEWVKCATTGCFLWPSRLTKFKSDWASRLPIAPLESVPGQYFANRQQLRCHDWYEYPAPC